MYTINALLFAATLMILHLSRMRRNVTRLSYNARKNVSATTLFGLSPDYALWDKTGSNTPSHSVNHSMQFVPQSRRIASVSLGTVLWIDAV